MESDDKIILAVIAGTALMTLLVFVIIIFVIYYSKRITQKENEHRMSLKNKELELLRMVIDAQEAEREKIAANLHDEVGPLLSTLKLNISKYKRDLDRGTLTTEALDNEREFIDQIVDNVRTASHHLTPHFVLKYGLLKGLRNFVSTVTTTPIVVHSNFSGDVQLNKQINLNVYRVTLELINNALKHDRPTAMTLELLKEPGELILRLSHDGRGLTQEEFESKLASGKGLGLESIKSRVVILNATIFFESKTSGSQTKIIIPIKND